MTLPTITREQLLDITEQSIAKAEKYLTDMLARWEETLGDDVYTRNGIRRARASLAALPEAAEHARQAARTVDRVIHGWWNADAECGCLIGSFYGAKVYDRDIDPDLEAAEDEIAYAFPGRLVALVGDIGDNDVVLIDGDPVVAPIAA